MYNISLDHTSTHNRFSVDLLGFDTEHLELIKKEMNTRLNLIDDMGLILLKKFLIADITRPGGVDRFTDDIRAGETYAYLVEAGEPFKRGDQDSDIVITIDTSLYYQELVNLLIRIENETRIKARDTVENIKALVSYAYLSADITESRFNIALTAMYSSVSKRAKFLIKDLMATRSCNGGEGIGEGKDHEMQFFTVLIKAAYDNLMGPSGNLNYDSGNEAEHYLKRITVLYGYLELIEYWQKPDYNIVLNEHLFNKGLNEETT